MKVETNTIVSLRYSMKNNQGDLLDDILKKDPVEYLYGAGSILPILETNIAGMECGEKKSVFITPENASDLNESFQIDVIIDNVRAASEEEIQIGKPFPVYLKGNCGPGCSC